MNDVILHVSHVEQMVGIFLIVFAFISGFILGVASK